MALYSSSNAANGLTFATNPNLCVSGVDYTWTGWAKLDSIPGASAFYGYLACMDATDHNGWAIWMGNLANNIPSLEWASGGSFGFGDTFSGLPTPATNVWFHWAIRYKYIAAGAVVDYWLNGQKVQTHTSVDTIHTIPTVAGNLLQVMNNPDEAGPAGAYAYMRMWRRFLSDGEIRQSMYSRVVPATLRSGLLVDLPLEGAGSSTVVEYDRGPLKLGASTTVGTVKWASGPPIGAPSVLPSPIVGAYGVTSSGVEITTFTNIFSDSSEINLVSDTIKVALFPNSISVPNFSTDTAYGVGPFSTTNEVTGTGYTAGGQTLTSKVLQESPPGTIMFDADDAVWSSSTITARCALIYDATVANSAICLVNFGGDVSTSSSTFTLHWSTAGILTFTNSS